MKKFTLNCESGHSFSGWFGSNEALAEELSASAIACPECGSTAVAKGLQLPNISPKLGRDRSRSEATTPAQPVPQNQEVIAPSKTAPSKPASPPPAVLVEQFARLYTAVKKVQEHVEKNFDNVGTGFAEEARKIHYGESPERGIVGQASKQDVEELEDEGIDVLPMPQLPKADA